MFETFGRGLQDTQEVQAQPPHANEGLVGPASPGLSPEAVQQDLAARIGEDNMFSEEAAVLERPAPTDIPQEPATPAEGGNGGEEPPAEIHYASGDEGGEGKDREGESGERTEASEHQSNLSPEMQALVRTPEFKTWFGDWENDPANASKIVDENGEPRVVYIGAPAGIRQFTGEHRNRTGPDEIGFYSTKRESNARAMAEQIRDPLTDEPAPASVYGAFISMKDPYEVQPGDGVDSTRVTSKPKDHDGYINDKLQEMVVFEPSQIFVVSETRCENGAPDETETESKAELVVEHRRAGNSTEITAALCAHTQENSAAIAKALRDCDIIALEGIGNSSNKRIVNEQAVMGRVYTELLSSKTDPKLVDRALTAGIKKGDVLCSILNHFRGSDKEVRLLDISGEQKKLLPDDKKAHHDFYDSVTGLAPLEVSRAACRGYIEAITIKHDVRDGYMSRQLKRLVDEVDQRPEPASIGVMMGMTHWSAVVTVSEAADPAASERALEEIVRHLGPTEWAAIAGAAGDLEAMRTFADRALVAKYLSFASRFSPANEDGSFPRRDDVLDKLDQAAMKLSQKEVTGLLGQLERDLSDPEEENAIRLRKIIRTLDPITRQFRI